MRILLICFVMFFGAMEFYQWMQGFAIPTPLFIAAGMLLAIASNLNKPAGLPWKSSSQPLESGQPAIAPPKSAPPPHASPQLPNLNPQLQPRSISFTIHKLNSQKKSEARSTKLP